MMPVHSSDVANILGQAADFSDEVLDISGLGPKRVQAIYEELGVTTLEELEKAAKQGRIAELDGFGAKTQQIIDDLEQGRGQTLDEMAHAAQERGYGYIAITGHSTRVAVTQGLDAEALRQRIDEIDQPNEKLEDVRILTRIKVDILADGSLDLPDAVLARLDIVIGVIHGQFDLSRDKQTEWIIRATDNPHFSILAHPTGRLIGQLELYAVDMGKVMGAALERGCYLEVNAYPDRLDFDGVRCRMAKEMGLTLSISTDAHRVSELAYIRFGVGRARSGRPPFPDAQPQGCIGGRGSTEL